MTRSGTVHDIRTGRAMFKTNSLNESFVDYINTLAASDTEFYIVHGRCRHLDMRQMLDQLKKGFTVIYDSQLPSDWVGIFDGDPAELGFIA